MKFLDKLHISAIVMLLGAVAAASGVASCDAVYDDLDPCPTGAELRFVYDYHMERGNAFMYNVDCLTVYFYDTSGHLVETRTETGSCLADEDWRMAVELPAGTYRAVAYGGMACGEASFEHPSGIPQTGSVINDLGAALKTGQHDGTGRGYALHDHFWGATEFTVTGTSPEPDKATVEMRKNTNNIRIVLQHLNGEPVDPERFDFTLIADNTRMGADNSLVRAGETLYKPWAKGTTDLGMLPDGTTLQNAYAQISTSRLVENVEANPRIRVSRVLREGEADTRSGDDTVLDLDLIWLIKLARQQHDVKDMELQEYLDRESRWSFIFLLDKNDNYYSLRIKVNDWEVRINNIEG